MLRALIVDDEPLARDELAGLLVETGRFTIAGACGNAVDALKLLRAERPDVLFLDVQMPGVSGFELLGMLDDDLRPLVVFVTAHDAFAVRAFEERAVDYLLKPVELERLERTADHLEQRRGEVAAAPPLAAPEITRIPCSVQRAIKLVPTADVELVRSSEAGVFVVTAAGEFFTELTLAVLEARTGLLRCHKQFLVHPDRIDEISLGDNSLAVIKTRSGKTVPVSRRHLSKLRSVLGV
jgi:two-component system LytT family response regulator